jgi:hypothetical protein
LQRLLQQQEAAGTINKKIVPPAKILLEDKSEQKVTKQQIAVNKVYATIRFPYQIRNVLEKRARFVYSQHNTVTATMRVVYGI